MQFATCQDSKSRHDLYVFRFSSLPTESFLPDEPAIRFFLNSRAIFYLSSHAMINKAILLQLLHIVNIPAIQDQRGCHQFFDGRPGRHPKFFPFRDEQEGVGIHYRVIDVFGIVEGVSQTTAGFLHRDRVEDIHFATGSQ